MYYIVEKSEQLLRLPVSKTAFVQLVLGDSRFHPMLASPSLLYYNNGDKGYMLTIDHSESFSLDIKEIESFLNSHDTIYLLDAKFHAYHFNLINCVDLNLVMLDSNNHVKHSDCDTLFHRQLYNSHGDSISNVDRVVPISKQYEKCECFYDQIKYLIGLESVKEFDKAILEAYRYVESAGIGVNESLFKSIYSLPNSSPLVRNSVAYSYYNLYNLTGRPTNSFLGVNFLAIPKEGDFRKCFVAKNDYLVEFDFDAYHLRLIAKLVGYEISSSESMHRVLAGHYFNKPANEITEEEYKQAKVITFRQLYGGVESQYEHIDFLSSMKTFVDSEFKKYKAQSHYVLPTERVLRDNNQINKHKLFNYIVQSLETKTNVDKILSIKRYLLDKKTRLILITYDAFLFDFSVQDGKETLIGIKEILESNGYPTKHRYGKDYSFTEHS